MKKVELEGVQNTSVKLEPWECKNKIYMKNRNYKRFAINLHKRLKYNRTELLNSWTGDNDKFEKWRKEGICK